MNSSEFERLVDASSADAEKGAEIIAKTFYRTLRKNGFSERQIICVGTTIISCLIDHLREYEQRVEQKDQNRRKGISVDPQ